MQRRLVLHLSLILACTASRSAFAQETATTPDGRRVILNKDGTWRYNTNSSNTASTSAIETLRVYLSASSWRDRIPLVLTPDKVKPLMEARYGGKPWKSPQFEILTSSEPTPSQTGWVKIQAEVDGTPLEYYLKKTKDSYRIDWETSVGSNPISTEEFHATRPTTPVRFRASAQLTDYYNYEFRDAQDLFWSFALKDGGEKEIGHGYAKKNSTAGQDLFKKLKDGKTHLVVVDLQCPPNASDGRVFLITKVVNLEGWWIEEPEAIGQQPSSPVRSPPASGRR